MKRREFNQTVFAASVGSLVTPAWACSTDQKTYPLRLGGPVFEKYNGPEEWVKAIRKLEYTAAYCPIKIEADSSEIMAYKKEAANANIVIAEVGAWSNPIDPDQVKAKLAIEKNTKSLQLADEIGANCCVNISGSRNPEKWAGPHKDNLTKATFDLIVETVRKIIDTVKPNNTYYTLETMPWSYPDSVESYAKLVKAIDRKRFAVHFDPVNLVVSPQVYYNNGQLIKEAFKTLGKYIKSCHAKDILLLDNKLTPHLPEVRAGLGNLNYSVFLKEMAKLKDIPLMMEHLKTAEEYNKAAMHIRAVGKENDIFF